MDLLYSQFLRGTVWKTAVFGILSLAWLPGLESAECTLRQAVYMPFLVRIFDSSEHHTIATGSIVTPISVLTTCVKLRNYDTSKLQAIACQARYSVGTVDENHFKQASNQEDTEGCVQTRNIKTKREHPHCPTKSDEALYTENYTRYNVAVLIVQSPFRNYTETLPTLPFIADIGGQLDLIDTFNTIRSVRCEVPIYLGHEPKSKYYPSMSFRSMALQLECKNLMCKGQPEECNKTMADSTAFIVCAKRVKQPLKGITWIDYIGEDRDYYTDDLDNCKDVQHIFGAPLMCQGSAVGIVTECNFWGMVISTIFTLRVQLHSLIEEGYTEKIIFMDVTTKPSRRPREADLQSFAEIQIPEENTHLNSDATHQNSFHKGIFLLTINAVFLIVI